MSFAQLSDTSFNPIRVMEIELTAPILPIVPIPDQNYGAAYILIRLHTTPIGVLHIPLTDGGLSSMLLAEQIWARFSSEINAHLQADGQPTLDSLPTEGITEISEPICQTSTPAGPDAQPFISVVIPTHDRADLLQKCVDSLLAQTYTNYELIIVDDAPSNNATLALYRQRYGANPRVRYVYEPRPAPSWARNRGLKAVRANYTAFVDDDVIVDRHWLAEIVKAFSSGPDVLCVTTLLLPVELETQSQYWFEQYGGFNKGFTARLYDLKENRPDNPLFPYTAGQFGTGGAFAFRTEWLRNHGGCDPNLRAGEDLSLFFEAIMAGHQLAYQPSAVGWHRHRQSYESLQKQIYAYGWGFSAFVTRSILHKPLRLFGLLARLRGGLTYMFSPKSAKNLRKQPDYPLELTALERRGLFRGPWVYFRQCWTNWQLYRQPQADPLAEPNLLNS